MGQSNEVPQVAMRPNIHKTAGKTRRDSKAAVEVGSTIIGVTHGGREIRGVVVKPPKSSGVLHFTHYVRWFDQNGKHYEWFNLNDLSEFATIKIWRHAAINNAAPTN